MTTEIHLDFRINKYLIRKHKLKYKYSIFIENYFDVISVLDKLELRENIAS
jgi:hypothetical protein